MLHRHGCGFGECGSAVFVGGRAKIWVLVSRLICWILCFKVVQGWSSEGLASIELGSEGWLSYGEEGDPEVWSLGESLASCCFCVYQPSVDWSYTSMAKLFPIFCDLFGTHLQSPSRYTLRLPLCLVNVASNCSFSFILLSCSRHSIKQYRECCTMWGVVCQGLMIMLERYFFFILCYWQKYMLMPFVLCNRCVCRSFHTIMQKTFLWLVCVSSMAGVFARILAGFLMQSCLAMRLICWKSVYRYFFSFASIDSLILFTLNGCIN